MTMLDEWLSACLQLSRAKADFYAGGRKIVRNFSFSLSGLDKSLELSDCGYTKTKLRILTDHYVHQESIDAANLLWELRRQKTSYGSVGFSCYGHYIKNDPNKKSKRASVMGPCLQAVMLTQLPKKEVAVTISYRTTELFKKFPADLVLIRDVLLPKFNFEGMKIIAIDFHFANVTCHPMYFVQLLPYLTDPRKALDGIKEEDKYYFDWIVKWTARYLCPEYHRGIQKFSQAMHVYHHAIESLTPRQLRELQDYLRANHPGYRNGYEEPEEEEE